MLISSAWKVVCSGRVKEEEEEEEEEENVMSNTAMLL
jgi:hypothetical protein